MNTQDNNQLEEMRSQMAILQSKLNNETIVNERLLRESMKHSYSGIDSYLKLQLGLLPLIFVGMSLLVLIYDLSWYPAIFLFAITIYAVIFDRKINRLRNDAFASENLIDTALRLQRAKKLSFYEMWINMPLVSVWFIWFVADFVQHFTHGNFSSLPSEALGGIIGGLIGGACGLIYDFSLYNKQQKIRQQLIDQINDLKGGE